MLGRHTRRIGADTINEAQQDSQWIERRLDGLIIEKIAWEKK
jgi:hypothetical protein